MPFLKCLLLITLLLAATPAKATVMLPVSIEQMTGKATVIALGEVKDMMSRWTPDRSRIETYVKLKVKNYLKGKRKDNTLILHQWGGKVGKLVQEIHGNPHYRIGEEVLVFLKTRNGDHMRVVDMAQGKWRLTRSSRTKGMLFKRDLKGITFAARHPKRAS